jgi:hypothetical protein
VQTFVLNYTGNSLHKYISFNTLTSGGNQNYAAGQSAFQVNTGAMVTDDTTPAFSGTLSGVVGNGQVLAVYDGGSTYLGTEAVTNTSWTYKQTTLTVGSHTFRF